MKTLFRGLASVAVSLFLLTGVALASHPWEIRMSDPTTSNQLRTFNIEYTALSVNSTDQITVKLLENSASKASQTTQPGGDSGVFTVSVPADGTYTYRMDASSSFDGTTKSTPSKSVTVTTPRGGQTSEITVSQSQAGAGGTGNGTTAGQTTTAPTAAEGQAGQVDSNAAVTNPGDVLGSEAAAKAAAAGKKSWIMAILGLIAAFIYAWYMRRQNKDILGRKKQ